MSEFIGKKSIYVKIHALIVKCIQIQARKTSKHFVFHEQQFILKNIHLKITIFD